MEAGREEGDASTSAGTSATKHTAKGGSEEDEGRGCVFLSKEGQCGIYEARPIQCSTYPWWPSLLESEEAWEDEAVVPDDQEGEHWNEEDGGCEGIGHAASERVPSAVIDERRQVALDHWKRFPGFWIKRRTWRL